MTQLLHIGCDIGGTFTDVVAIDSDGTVFTDKADTTPADLSQGVLDALENLAATMSIRVPDMLARATRFVNGTTIVTNSVAELRGARVGLITTKGFGDSLLIARSARNASRDNHKQLNLPQIVPRELVVEVTERVDSRGEVIVPLTRDEARRAVERLVDCGVQAIAVSLLWSFLHPGHEELIASVVREEHPDLFLSVGSLLSPAIREYERTMTAVLNAFTGLRVAEYVTRVEEMLTTRGLTVPPVYMQGFGGSVSAAEAIARPIMLIDSGPAGGVIGARALAQQLGIRNMVTADMGGTSFDVSVLRDFRTSVTQRVMLRDQFLTALPKIDLLPIGSGGGSVAWIDARGVPRVGPTSAGAYPGPVCYGRGGTSPTVTDAVAALGLLDPGAFLGGGRELDVDAGREALVREIGAPLGLDGTQAASAVYRIVTADMSNAVRAVTVERGHDPRAFTMLAYGGATGLFAADIARLTGIGTVVVPGDAAVFSARGLLASDDMRTKTRSVMWSGGDASAVSEAFGGLEDELVAALRDTGFPREEIDVQWQGDFKFAGQQWELTVPITRIRSLSTTDLTAIQEGFPHRYEAEFGEGTAWVGAPVVMVAARVVATGRVERMPARREEPSSGRAVARARRVWMPLAGQETDLAVHDARDLVVGQVVAGPAIIEHRLTTVVVPKDWELTVDEWRNLRMLDRSVSVEPAQLELAGSER